jgi:hypothetical protein
MIRIAYIFLWAFMFNFLQAQESLSMSNKDPLIVEKIKRNANKLLAESLHNFFSVDQGMTLYLEKRMMQLQA